MDTLSLKLALTPGLILVASLAGRRWGESVGGWLVGLPLTSAPVAFFLALDHGTGFAAAAAAGSIAGTAAQACFSVAYSRAAWTGWFGALCAGTVAFVLAGWLLQRANIALLPLFVIALLSLAAGGCLVPHRAAVTPGRAPPRFDLPARMLLATAVVVAVTAAAPVLGPRLSGLLATYPVFATVLGVFAHRVRGPEAAQQAFFGLLLGLYAFAGFFLVLGLGIQTLGIAGGFMAAAGAAMLVQGATLWIMRRQKQV